MPALKITTVRKTLSDGSHVYDVHIGNVVLDAVTQKDAEDLVEKLAAAIEAHTNERVVARYEETFA